MVRVCLIGAGDVEFHYGELLGIPEEELSSQLGGIASALAKSGVEIVILPDRGISFEVAKEYKRLGGAKVIGTVPMADTEFGTAHLQQYIEAEVEGRKLLDEKIDTGNWYKQDMTHCLFGDIVLMLGNSLGSMGELAYGYYLFKLAGEAKPGVETTLQKIHPQAIAGTKVPFTTIIYEPFFKELLNSEIEGYISKYGGRVLYVKSHEELADLLAGIIGEWKGGAQK